jgi:tetratricopeptide (TPR) repeat protein
MTPPDAPASARTTVAIAPILRRVLRSALIVLVPVVFVAGLVWFVRPAFRSRPSLDEAVSLAEAGAFDQAEAKLRARLAATPDESAAHLLLAQVLLRRPDPPPTPVDRPSPGPGRAALEHLDRVRPENPRMAVLLETNRGNALYRLMRLEEAEAAWLRALQLNSAAPEVGWSLLDLWYLQGREDEARRLALHLFEVEPDPRDRVQLLLELVRQDARPPAPGSLVKWFAPVVRDHPDDLRSTLAMGLALVRDSRIEPGLDLLRDGARRHPGRPEAWDGLLTALDESGQLDGMREVLDSLPPTFAAEPRLAKHRARVAQEDRAWEEAVRQYRLARRAEPFNRTVEYRLSRALRHAGDHEEANQIEQRVRVRDRAMLELRTLYDEAGETTGPGPRPRPDLYRRLADVREQMQRLDEARAWHRLVLQVDPQNPESRAALDRLGTLDDRP